MDKKKMIGSLVTIGATGALLAGATFAFFSKQATSNNNTFSSGTLLLGLDDVNEATPSASIAQSISASNFAPGDSTSGFISLHHSGTITLAEVDFTAKTTETSDPSPASNMKTVLNLTVKVANASNPISS